MEASLTHHLAVSAGAPLPACGRESSSEHKRGVKILRILPVAFYFVLFLKSNLDSRSLLTKGNWDVSCPLGGGDGETLMEFVDRPFLAFSKKTKKKHSCSMVPILYIQSWVSGIMIGLLSQSLLVKPAWAGAG